MIKLSKNYLFDAIILLICQLYSDFHGKILVHTLYILCNSLFKLPNNDSSRIHPHKKRIPEAGILM